MTPATPPSRHLDVAIIGGGVIGLFCAYYLKNEGFDVCVLERERVGAGASHGNCGLLVPSAVVPLCAPGAVGGALSMMGKPQSALMIRPGLTPRRYKWLLDFARHCTARHVSHAAAVRHALLTRSKALYDKFLQLDSLSCDQGSRGALHVYKHANRINDIEPHRGLLERYGVYTRTVDQNHLRQMAPKLATDVSGAWFHPDDRHLRPDKLLAELKRLLNGSGAHVVENSPVTDFETTGRAVTRIRVGHKTYHARQVVLAAGAWSPEISRKLGCLLPIEPGKGYSLTFDGCAPPIDRPCFLVEAGVVYTPFENGFRIGGLLDFAGMDQRLTPAALEKLRRAMAAYLGPLPGGIVPETWAGPRPMVYDELPIIGRMPGVENMWIASGHGKLGISMGPATGEAIADLLAGRTPRVNLAGTRPTRF